MMRTEQNNEIIKNKKSEVKISMGRIIANKVKGMNWMAKVSLILVFTVMFSTFMLAGLLMPKEAVAAAVNYHTLGTTTQSVGFDGSTNIVLQATTTYTNTPGGPNAELRAIATTAAPAGTLRNQIYAAAAATTYNTTEMFRAYTPAYAYDMKIAANASTRIAVYTTATGTSGSVYAEMYEYNDTIGLIGAAKGATTVQAMTVTDLLARYYTLTFSNPEFKVGAGNRIAVVYYASAVGTNPAYLYGATDFTTPSGSTYITVDESRYFYVTTCGDCHGYPNQDGPWVTARNTPPGKFPGSHLVHSATCAKCHDPVPVATNHRNGRVEFTTMFGGRPGSYSETGANTWFTQANTVSPGTCTVTCHSPATPTWGTTGTGFNCVSCHNVARPKTLGGQGTIRNVTGAGGDYSRASRHLFWATLGQILKWDCIICHREGFAGWYTPNQYYRVGRTDAAYHNEGTGATGGMINLRNVDDPSTGWAINNRAWTTTDYTNLDTFCLTCHDADGANGISVNATNNGLDMSVPSGRRLTPFNSANYPGGVVGASTFSANAGQRTRIVDIKSKFYPGTVGPGPTYNGNPSQHAVIGRRYSTIFPQWTSNVWAVYTLKKTGQNLRVTRETSLLSCADCHVLDAGSGAHGGNNMYNMWTSGVSNFCHRCHSSTVYTLNTGAGAGARITHDATLEGNNWNGTETAYLLPAGAAAQNCLLCHASWNGATTVTRNASYGGIHGSWSSTAWYSTAGTRTAYRFAPGAYMKFSPPGDGAWGSGGTGSCYFNAAGDKFTSCGQHSGTQNGAIGNSYNYGRPPKY